MLNPYEVLGVDKYDDDQTVKKAYRQLSKQYHPDNNINNPNKEAAEETFKKIQLAYEEIMHERSLGIGGPNDIRRNRSTYSESQSQSSNSSSSGQWGSTRTAEKERSDYSGPWGFTSSFNENNKPQTAYSDSFYGRNGEKSTQGNYNTNQTSGSYYSGGYYTGGKKTTYGNNRNPYSAGGGYYTGGKNFYSGNGNGGYSSTSGTGSSGYSSSYGNNNNYNDNNTNYQNNNNNNSYNNNNTYNSSYNDDSYGNSNSYGNNNGYNDQNYNSGSYDNNGYGNESYNETSDTGYYQSDADMQNGLNEAAAAINNRDFYRALDILNSIRNRNDVWFYYSAIANLALGNNITALSQARTAKGMNPNRPEYDELISGMEGGTLQYRGRAGTFVPQKVDKGNICVKLIIANIVLNVVCGGGGFILGPCISC